MLDTPINIQLSKFWEWWTSEIKEVIPTPLKKLIERRQQLVLLEAFEGRIAIVHQNGSREKLILTCPISELTPPQRALFKDAHPELAEIRIALRIRRDQGISRIITLPLAAEENLPQVAGLEMDRITPFRQDQVYFSARVIERKKTARQILAKITLVPKVFLDETLEHLEAAGWGPSLVFLTNEDKPSSSNLLPERFRPKPNKWLEGINIALTSCAIASLILMLVLPAWMTRVELNKIQSELKKTTKIAKDVEAMQEEAEKLFQQAKFLQNKKQTEPIIVDAFEELSRVIPDDTWLNGLQYANHRVVIQGQSPSASSLLKKIEGSRFFRDVSFVSPVTKDSSNGLERFQIAFDLINGRFSEEAH